MSLDKDSDKLVSRKEFSDGGEAMFKKLDADSDGQVTKAELVELPTRLLK
jgi:Ca2+-binding EF-hand superfamily protein